MSKKYNNGDTYIVHKVKETKKVTRTRTTYDTFGDYDLIYEIYDEVKWVVYKNGKFYDRKTKEEIEVEDFIDSSCHMEANYENQILEYKKIERILYSYPVLALKYHPKNLPSGSKINLLSKISRKNAGIVKLSFDREEALRQIDDLIYKPNNLELPTKKESKYGEEIDSILLEISNTTNGLPKDVRRRLLKEVEGFLHEYEEKLKELEPKLGVKPTLSINTIEGLKPALIANLQSVLIKLSTEKETLDFLRKLNNYEKMLNNDKHELADDNNITGEINNILYYANYIDDKESIKELSTLILDAKNKASLDVKNISNGNNFPKDINYVIIFEQNISKLHEKIHRKYESVKPFMDLLIALNSKQTELLGGESIEQLLASVRFAISEVKRTDSRKMLEEKLSEIIQKHRATITNIISNQLLLDTSNPQKIANNIEKDINDLSILINDVIYQEAYFYDKANKENIIDQLEICKSWITKGAFPTEDTENLGLITSYVYDFLNKILSSGYSTNNDNGERGLITSDELHLRDENGSTYISDDKKGEAIKDLEALIDKAIKETKETEIKSIEDYNSITKQIVFDFSEVEASLFDYLLEKKRFEKHK